MPAFCFRFLQRYAVSFAYCTNFDHKNTENKNNAFYLILKTDDHHAKVNLANF